MSDWHREETYKSLIQIGVTALKFVLIANGGAAVALLAFINSIYTSAHPLPHISFAMGAFLGGVFSGGLACLTGYLTQLSLYNEQPDNSHTRIVSDHRTWLYISLVLVFVGIILFGIGSWQGLNSIYKSC